MVAIPFPTSSAPGRMPQESAGRIINAYVEAVPKQPARPIYYRVPGLTRLTDTSAHGHCRGLHVQGGTLLQVLDERVYAVTGSGSTYTAVDLGELPGTDTVTIASNLASPTPQIVAVCSAGCYNLFTGSAPTSFADPDLPAVNSVAFYSGYFVWTTGNGYIYTSGLADVEVDALSFDRAQKRDDGLLRGVAFRGEFFSFGQASIEVWRDVGSSPFPLSFVTMIPRGLIAPHAVAGAEPGWSNELLWVGDDNVVYRLDGYTPVRVSTHSVERAIYGVADKTTLKATVYMVAGHSFWALSSDEWTWEFDLLTGLWHERKSYDLDRWRGERSAKLNGEWVIGDHVRGWIYRIDETSAAEHDDPLPLTIESDAATGFPAQTAVPRADFWFTAGTGLAAGRDPVQTDPHVSISWSDDGGYSWGNELVRPIGRQGAAEQQVTVTRTGLATRYGRRWRVMCADPVHFGFLGGDMSTEGRAA